MPVANLERACIVFTPITEKKRAISIGEYGFEALTMMPSNRLSNPAHEKVLFMLSEWPRAVSFLINSRSRTRLVMVSNIY